MGQQQLLLLTLGIVIVGVATVAGIQIFSENRIRANADAAVATGLRIVSDCQVWAIKPPLYNGRGINETVADCDFIRMGYPASTGGTYHSVDGSYTGVKVCLGIAGTRAGDIGTRIDYP